jgi:hypothetical protein
MPVCKAFDINRRIFFVTTITDKTYSRQKISFRSAVLQLVETLSYKPEGRGFDSRWCYWNFSLT